MASQIIEFFGYSPEDDSEDAEFARTNRHCPFIDDTCTKTLNDGEISGACTLKPKKGSPVICCPIRLYAEDYKILKDIAAVAFNATIPLVPAKDIGPTTGECIAVFGKRWGKELRLPNRGKRGSYFMDWVLAHIDANGDLLDFVAVEVQSIDTTGNYRDEREAHLARLPAQPSTAGFNWENVNKRILPQLIYKGHVLRQEAQCTKGLFFVCPTPVYEKIRERLGGQLRPYPLHAGALTFMWYDIDPTSVEGTPRALNQLGTMTTTIDQVALAFTAPSNLPDAGVYAAAIKAELR